MTTTIDDVERDPAPAGDHRRTAPGVAEGTLRRSIDEILSRRAAVGLAVGLVAGSDAVVDGRGLADIASQVPIDEDTVFRVGSLTKLFTAIAVMQLVEAGRLDLDAPANDSLRAYRLVATNSAFRPATVRHLLTHTSGVPEVVHLGDLLHPGWGPFGSRPAELSVPSGRRLPSLAAYYAGGLRVAAEPGTVFQYSNHGYATLGQIVEDVAGISLERYFRERLFEPLGMTDTDLARTERIAARLARGYTIGRGGPVPVPDRDWICRFGAGGIYSTARDMTRFVAALLGGGANDHGRVIGRPTLESMMEPHYRPDPRLPGRGLGFVRGMAGGHLIVGHDGLLPGFDSLLLVAPRDGLGIVALTNGSPGAHVWLGTELHELMRELIGVPADEPPSPPPHHPEIWPVLCGRYRLPPGSDLRGRAALRGAEVMIRGGRLVVRVLTPIPFLHRDLPLRPADRLDPRLFELDLSAIGLPPVRVAFGGEAGAAATAVHVDLPGQPLTLERVASPGWGSGGRPAAALGAAAIGTVAMVARRRRGGTRPRRMRITSPRSQEDR